MTAILAGAATAASRAPVTLVAHDIADTAVIPAVAQARAIYRNSGALDVFGSATPSVGADEWLTAGQGSGAGDDYEIFADFVSGDPLDVGDPTNQWLALTVDRFWGLDVASGSKSTALDVSIRRNSVVYGPVRIQLDAEAVPI